MKNCRRFLQSVEEENAGNWASGKGKKMEGNRKGKRGDRKRRKEREKEKGERKERERKRRGRDVRRIYKSAGYTHTVQERAYCIM